MLFKDLRVGQYFQFKCHLNSDLSNSNVCLAYKKINEGQAQAYNNPSMERNNGLLDISPFAGWAVIPLTYKLKDLEVGDVFTFIQSPLNNPLYYQVMKNNKIRAVGSVNTGYYDNIEERLLQDSTISAKLEVNLVAKTMNIMEALQALKDGKKITGFEFGKGEYIYADENGIIRDEDGTECTIGDIDNIFIKDMMEYIPKVEVEVSLNDEYTATVTSEGVKVGCQTFSLDKIEELVQAAKKVKSGAR